MTELGVTRAPSAATTSGAGARRRVPLALRRPAWLAGLAAVAVFAAAAAFLGTWQWDRGEAADARDDSVADHYDLPPVDPGEVVVDGAVPRDAQWTPVRLTGRYDPAIVAIRNRPQDGRNGFFVTSPFVLDRAVDGRDVIWVVRGWAPATDQGLPAVPAPPTGPTEVVARVRVAEQALGRPGPDGQTYRIAAADLAAAADVPVAARAVDGYAILAAGAAGSGQPLVEIPRPARDPGPHLAYALQWWLFSVAGFGIWFAFYRRSAREEAARDAAFFDGAVIDGAAIDGTVLDAAPRESGSAAGTGSRAAPPPPDDEWTYRPGG